VCFAVKTLPYSFKALLFSALLGLVNSSPAWAGPSPWWEQYEREDRYRCGDRGEVLLERNESQASLYRDGYRINLFRDQNSPMLKRYSNERLKLTIQGDELTLEDLLTRSSCIRFEQV
jgi:hypothetical protein